jgi:hypothetical protein
MRYPKEHLNGRTEIPLKKWRAERDRLTAEYGRDNRKVATYEVAVFSLFYQAGFPCIADSISFTFLSFMPAFFTFIIPRCNKSIITVACTCVFMVINRHAANRTLITAIR